VYYPQYVDFYSNLESDIPESHPAVQYSGRFRRPILPPGVAAKLPEIMDRTFTAIGS
jgi:hypothetical protein